MNDHPEFDEPDQEDAAPEEVTRGDELFGEPDVRPSMYYCHQHGMILAGDAEWRKTRAHCPFCGARLKRHS